MPMSVPGRCRPSRPGCRARRTCRGGRAPGFTLIEVMVVTVILAVAVTATLTMLSSRPADLRSEARRLATALEGAAMEARLSGRPTGWQCVDGGVAFARWTPVVRGEFERVGSWQETGGGAWRPAEGVRIASVSINGAAISCTATRLVLPAFAAAPVFAIELAQSSPEGGVTTETIVLRSDTAGRFALHADLPEPDAPRRR